MVRNRHLKTDSHISTNLVALDSEALSQYFLDPNAQLAHMFLTTKYASDLSSICRCLGIGIETLLDLISRLQSLKLVEMKAGKYVVSQKNFHLPADSPMYRAYRLGVRMRALEKLQNSPIKDNYSFSVIFSSDEQTRSRVHAEFLKFLARIERWFKDGKEEEVYQLNFDLMQWSKHS